MQARITLDERIARGEKAIALAKDRGLDTSYWQAELQKFKSLLAWQVAQRTEGLLAGRGWCVWRCSALGNDMIVVAADCGVPGIPQGKAIYTNAELQCLFGDAKPIDLATLKLVHEAKKLGAARVINKDGLDRAWSCPESNGVT